MVLFVSHGTHQDLLEEDLVEPTFLRIRCLEVGRVAVPHKREGGFEGFFLLETVALEGLEPALDLGQILFEVLLLPGHQLHG